ncbi:hypothetical protein JG688_00010870 [Phytophthora aleatoria]|uniref:Uncharacterized protein n=1 Tax=Phytophthora aleatoria TaxID=2496075 RepID=A0A8J5M5N3_9STRA|nr:hypothetical protein JG688_00010870 [Phytophthora aleatoria]
MCSTKAATADNQDWGGGANRAHRNEGFRLSARTDGSPNDELGGAPVPEADTLDAGAIPRTCLCPPGQRNTQGKSPIGGQA